MENLYRRMLPRPLPRPLRKAGFHTTARPNSKSQTFSSGATRCLKVKSPVLWSYGQYTLSQLVRLRGHLLRTNKNCWILLIPLRTAMYLGKALRLSTAAPFRKRILHLGCSKSTKFGTAMRRNWCRLCCKTRISMENSTMCRTKNTTRLEKDVIRILCLGTGRGYKL